MIEEKKNMLRYDSYTMLNISYFYTAMQIISLSFRCVSFKDREGKICAELWQLDKSASYLLLTRVRPRFFDQVGHETMYVSSGNKHIFTKSCHRQTYQNYDQSRQKLGTILENKVS